jgi:hypothetical protein
MDRAKLLDHVEQAKKQVADDELKIAHQETLISKLSQSGRATIEAYAFLRTLEERKAMHVARRDRLAQELATNTEARQFFYCSTSYLARAAAWSLPVRRGTRRLRLGGSGQ